jgi:signal transduction histidine kinase
VPIALVSLVDEDRQWFKSACGLSASETPRDMAFCAHAIKGDEPLVVLDATRDDRFCGNPLVLGPPFVNFYAGAPLISPEGHKLGTLCAIDDKPHRKFTKQECYVLETLAAMVVDEMELHRVNIKLEEQVQAKANFLAVMGHEIRTPMNGIVGMASLLADSELGEKEQRYVSIIQQSADEMMELLNDILDLSKLEAGKLRFRSECFDIIEQLKHTAEQTAAAAIAKGLALVFVYPVNMPAHVKGDMARLRQIMLNLLSNAIKFTDKGKVELRISAAKSAKKGQTEYCIEVKDTGIGIAPEDQARVFDSFDQVDMSSTRQHGGTGLGLAICRLLSNRMNGQISVKSEQGKGACFQLRISLPPDPERAELPHAALEDENELLFKVRQV